MTRPLVMASLVIASLALAQTPPIDLPAATTTTPAPTTTPDVTPPPPPPPLVGPPLEPVPPGPNLADRTEPQRFSRFSAGRGGALFAFSEFIAGMVGGGFLGGALSSSGRNVSNGVYVGVVVGGLLIGGLGIGVQYLHPIGLASAGAIALATGVGGLFGVGLSNAIGNGAFADARLTAGLLLAGTQVGALAALIALWSLEDLNGEDLALIGMATLYGFVVTALVTMIAAQGQVPVWPIFMSPAVGMGLGALWALGVDMAPGRVLKLTALPSGVGLILFYLGSLLAATGGTQLWGITTLAGVVATFGLTYIFTIDDDAPKPKKGQPTVLPTIALMPSGRRNEAIAAGPALLFSF